MPWAYKDFAAETAAGAWLARNAWKYGFVMSYPWNKDSAGLLWLRALALPLRRAGRGGRDPRLRPDAPGLALAAPAGSALEDRSGQADSRAGAQDPRFVAVPVAVAVAVADADAGGSGRRCGPGLGPRGGRLARLGQDHDPELGHVLDRVADAFAAHARSP